MFKISQVAAEYTSFCLDDRHRKFYIGNEEGRMAVFNASNGVFLKFIGEEEFDHEMTESKSNRIHKKANKTDHTATISGLCFVNENHMLITSSYDSTLNLYDEEDPEKPIRLRNLSGGHLDYEIVCLEASEHFALIASGGSNGYITLWDFEKSNVEGVCIFHTKEILAMKFLDPYPCLVSSSSDGYVCLWSVRGVNVEHPYTCLCCLMNFNFNRDPIVSSVVLSLATFIVKEKGSPIMNASELSEDQLKIKYETCIKGEYMPLQYIIH